ncbi:hypothetical protein [Intestinimonas sp. HCP28S3_D6]|uniref:hypothetical protein n=1 Tax=Intestinimonas sp. HCP28S3_D6 TaxID=3438942 RepID=UPI003F8B518B
MKNIPLRIGKLFLVVLPLILGMIGLWGMAGEPLLDALFSCVSMYVLNYGDPPVNLFVELARWLAPITTVSGIMLALRAIRDQARCLLRCWLGDCVVVYGPEESAERLTERLGRRGTRGGDRLLPARQYILLGDDGTSFDLCRQIIRTHPDADVFLQCADIQPQSVSSPRLHLFSPEETGARLFWKEHPLYPLSAAHGHRLTVVLLGFGRLGEDLLYYGLLDNIFQPDQHIEYHIFGGDGRFAAVHTQLDRLGDPVIFHEEPWWESLDLLRRSHLTLLLPQEVQAAEAQDLLLALPEQNLVIFTDGSPAADLLAHEGALKVFPWLDRALDPDLILRETLLLQAKQINLRYAHIYNNVEETPAAREAEWAALDAFTRYSNISCADYHDIRLNMMAALGWPADPAQLSTDQMELLAELEHIRWCRYHYLNNWRLGTPENGKRKDPVRRLHTDLIPYRDLDQPSKEKDRENIRVLLSIPPVNTK